MNRVIEILKETGAIIDQGHFVGVSGRHFDLYVNKDALLPHTEAVSEVCTFFADKYKDKNIDIVVAPALGGIILSQWTAHHLTKLNNREVLGMYTEKDEKGEQVFRRGYDKYITGKRILVLEDSAQTGGSVMKVINSVKQAGGEIIGACVMVNKDPANINSASLGVPLEALSELPVVTYPPDECPMCRDGVPVNTSIGHGKKFLAEQQGK